MMSTLIRAEDLKAFRQRYGLPQAALAQLLGASKRSVEEWEGGRNPAPPMLGLALAALAADLTPWRVAPVQITADGDGYRVRYEDTANPGFTGEAVAARAFPSREIAEAFGRFWEGRDTNWFGTAVEHLRRSVSLPSYDRRD